MDEFTRGFIAAQLTEKQEETVRVVTEELAATLKRCSDYQKQVEALNAEVATWISHAVGQQEGTLRALEERDVARVQRDAALSEFKECSDELAALRAQEPVAWLYEMPVSGERIASATKKLLPNERPLYTAPAPAAVPDECLVALRDLLWALAHKPSCQRFGIYTCCCKSCAVARANTLVHAATQEKKP